MTDAFRIEPLANSHDRAAFSSGAPQIDDWFHKQAGQASRRGIAAVHIMVDTTTGAMLGFYTLSNFTVFAADLPSEFGRTLPDRIMLPAHLIGQLAVDARQQGKGYGGLLLFDAVHRAHRMTEHSASLAVVVHALDTRAAAWYTGNGFVPFPAHPLSLFVPMRGVTRSFPRPISDNASA
ncbi:MAG: GNAT family N-acetyltransferase [Chloroflexota bacterium]|nr:GNAT family N-acetyltransferase [Chloroflexota bacterium]MDQ6906000.1 GNAT family N-acetyltransferase [Chloroflexota bacterium]